jgi:hypothetical protein
LKPLLTNAPLRSGLPFVALLPATIVFKSESVPE